MSCNAADDLTGLALSPKPRLDFFPLWHRCTLRLVGLLSPFSYTVGEWTLNASLTTSSSYRKCSKRRILGHSAQATSLRRIEGTTKCSPIAGGFGFGSVMVSVADLSLPHSHWPILIGKTAQKSSFTLNVARCPNIRLIRDLQNGSFVRVLPEEPFFFCGLQAISERLVGQIKVTARWQ